MAIPVFRACRRPRLGREPVAASTRDQTISTTITLKPSGGQKTRNNEPDTDIGDKKKNVNISKVLGDLFENV